jgi:hypothetical protein
MASPIRDKFRVSRISYDHGFEVMVPGDENLNASQTDCIVAALDASLAHKKTKTKKGARPIAVLTGEERELVTTVREFLSHYCRRGFLVIRRQPY